MAVCPTISAQQLRVQIFVRAMELGRLYFPVNVGFENAGILSEVEFKNSATDRIFLKP